MVGQVGVKKCNIKFIKCSSIGLQPASLSSLMKKVRKEIKKFLNSPEAAGSDIKTSDVNMGARGRD